MCSKYAHISKNNDALKIAKRLPEGSVYASMSYIYIRRSKEFIGLFECGGCTPLSLNDAYDHDCDNCNPEYSVESSYSYVFKHCLDLHVSLSVCLSVSVAT